ncbi:MAG: C1 family peptidase [Lachnospiraceae bacterium]|nr:C1 family peptidase [Lachnospiraceae bacterium]
MDTFVSTEDLRTFDVDFHTSPVNRIAMNAVISNGINATAKNYDAIRRDTHTYSISLPQGKVTNQKQSGRCWMFAALNCMRFQVMKKLNLEDFELSQNYTFFYDKLEKANYFLESILKTLDMPTDSRLIAHLLTAPVQDGGQWDMIANIVNKYGVVPKSAMPETKSSSSSREMCGYLTEKLRGFACLIRTAHENGATIDELRIKKEEMMTTIYRMLCISLGEPPKTFDFEYTDKDKNFHRDSDLTPKAFYEKYVDINLSDYISLINAPTKTKPFYRSYTVAFLGNVIEGQPVKYVNLPSAELKKAAIAQLKDGEPVWFGCDVGKHSGRDEGIMDLDIFNVEDLFSTKFAMDKGERLDYGQSLMTHAMVFQGVDLDEDGDPIRWRVENSWGDEHGDKGFYLMTDAWFDEYNYQVVVNKKYLPEDALKAFESEPIVLEPWDPMGSLA